MELNKKTSLLLACEIYPPDIGGPATYAQELRQQLLSHGHAVFLLTLGKGILRQAQDNNSVIIERGTNFVVRSLEYFFKLWQLSKDADVIYAMGPGMSGLCSVIIGIWLRKKVVVKVTGDRAWEAAKLKGSEEEFEVFQARRHSGWISVLERIERWVVRHADAVIVPGIFLKKIVVEWGAKNENVQVISNTIKAHPPLHPPLPKGETTTEIPPPKNGKVGGGVIILAIGRLVPWKGFDDLIEALPQVRARVPHVRLVIVGDGPERVRLESLAQEIDVPDSVQFTGKVAHEALGGYWASASVFTLVSSYEGFPHLVLEAWHAGVPVVASAIPANRDIINDGTTGLLVSYHDRNAIADAIIKILTDTQLSREITQKAKKELERYQWDTVIKKIEQVLFD